jgi:hypothetical protein
MAFKKTDYDHETAMNQLADSVLGLSDEAIVGEIGEAGADADDEAERTRQVLRMASQSCGLHGQCAEDIQRMNPRGKASSLKR